MILRYSTDGFGIIIRNHASIILDKSHEYKFIAVPLLYDIMEFCYDAVIYNSRDGVLCFSIVAMILLAIFHAQAIMLTVAIRPT